jgi:hypothetical protein
MKITGIWFMPLLFHGLMATAIELATSEFKNAVCPFTSDNPTSKSLGCQKRDYYQRTGWIQPVWDQAEGNTSGKDVEISLSTDVSQNRIQIRNTGELEVEYCLRHPPDNTWTDVKRLEYRQAVYLPPSINQVELHLRKIHFRTTP